MKEAEKKALLRKELKVDALGKVPLFFALINIDVPEENDLLQKNYQGIISIAKYQTKKYQTSGYHKPISKIV